MDVNAGNTIFTVRQFSEKYPAFSQGSLRSLIFMAKERPTSTGVMPGNGLDRALIHVGRRVLIDEREFLAWLKDQRDRQPN